MESAKLVRVIQYYTAEVRERVNTPVTCFESRKVVVLRARQQKVMTH